MLPYAIMENYDRLACAFYDYRADPDNKAAQAKCLVYAGNLSHFTGDCVMPLHTTRDYDGRKQADGEIKQKGIHAKIDAFPEKNDFTAEEVARPESQADRRRLGGRPQDDRRFARPD